MVFSVSVVADGEDKNGKLHRQQRPLQVSPCVKRFIYTNDEGETQTPLLSWLLLVTWTGIAPFPSFFWRIYYEKYDDYKTTLIGLMGIHSLVNVWDSSSTDHPDWIDGDSFFSHSDASLPSCTICLVFLPGKGIVIDEQLCQPLDQPEGGPHHIEDDTRLQLAQVVVALEKATLPDEYFIERKMYPNVDIYSGLIYRPPGSLML
ncbi:hypothetical protein ZWY2020_025034 [Hordeum vulgare]|nr:hypothetical protein ZWY2020_025034 [Hordeum vulgare]